MGFNEKCIENYESACDLLKSGRYNSCVNRIYYCMYDLILAKIINMKKYEKLKEYTKRNPTSHTLTITYFLDHLIKVKLNSEDYNRVWTNINAAKSARFKADYKPEHITEKNAKNIMKHGEQFREIINKVC